MDIAKAVTELWTNATVEGADSLSLEALLTAANRIADALERLAEKAEEPPLPRVDEMQRELARPHDPTSGFRARVANNRRDHPGYSLDQCIELTRHQINEEQLQAMGRMRMEESLLQPMRMPNWVANAYVGDDPRANVTTAAPQEYRVYNDVGRGGLTQLFGPTAMGTFMARRAARIERERQAETIWHTALPDTVVQQEAEIAATEPEPREEP